MHPGESRKRSVSPALGSGGSIDALPDGVLEHILGFLPAQDAVRTCVLAPRWRHLWRTAPGMRICSCTKLSASVKDQREFVDHLLLLRGSSPLGICEFVLAADADGEDEPRMNLWFRHVVMRGARVLRLHLFGDYYFDLDDLPLVSQHLTKLYLCSVRVRDSFLKFSSCPALENLELVECDISNDEKIASKSLKHLTLTKCVIVQDFDKSLQGPNYEVEMKGSYNLMERSAKISKNLNIVEVKCQVVDERVLKVLKFLCAFNISFTF